MLTVHLEDERCTAALKSGEMKVMEAYMGGLDADLPGHPPIPTASEDENRPSIDLEEGDASVELQPLNPPQSAPSGNRTPRVYRTGPTSSAPDRPIPLTSINLSTPTLVSLFHALNSSQDIFWSGTYSLGSFHLRDTWMMLRAQDADRAVASGESVDPNSSLYLLSQAATNHAIRARTQMARAAGAGIGAR